MTAQGFLEPPRSAIGGDLRIDEQQAISYSLEPAADRGEIVPAADSHRIGTASAYDRGYVVSRNCTVDTAKPPGPEVSTGTHPEIAHAGRPTSLLEVQRALLIRD